MIRERQLFKTQHSLCFIDRLFHVLCLLVKAPCVYENDIIALRIKKIICHHNMGGVQTMKSHVNKFSSQRSQEKQPLKWSIHIYCISGRVQSDGLGLHWYLRSLKTYSHLVNPVFHTIQASFTAESSSSWGTIGCIVCDTTSALSLLHDYLMITIDSFKFCFISLPQTSFHCSWWNMQNICHLWNCKGTWHQELQLIFSDWEVESTYRGKAARFIGNTQTQTVIHTYCTACDNWWTTKRVFCEKISVFAIAIGLLKCATYSI